jgi:lipoprotein-releasing system permease protein
MLGVATLIIVMSVMNGFRIDLMNRILGINSHITIYSKNFTNSTEVLKIIEKEQNVKYADKIIDNQVMLMVNGNTSGAIIKGIEEQDLKNKDRIYNKKFNFDENSILIGMDLAMRLGVARGDEVKVISPELNTTLFGAIPRIKTYKVGGIFSSGLYEYDVGFAFVPLKTAQKHFKYEDDRVGSIEIYLNDVNLTTETAKSLQKKLEEYDIQIVDWQASNREFMSALDVERNVMFLILMLIILVATFNIISSLTMLVNDKIQQIALLRTVGFTKISIMQIFFICGSIIGCLGTTLGVSLGVLVSSNLQTIKIFLEQKFSIQLFPASVYYLTELPSKIVMSDVVMIVSLSLILSFLSTLYPAYKASKTNLAEVLRYQ